MFVNFPSVAEAITRLYRNAEVRPLYGDRSIAPLRAILGSLNLNCVELPKLTSRAAADYLLLRGVPVSRLENTNEVPLAGYLHASMNFGCIFVNQDDRVTRRRFSVAHEVGHFVLHFRPLLDELKRQGESLSISITDAPCVIELNGEASSEDIADSNFTGQVSFSDSEMVAGLLPSLEQMEKEADLFASELLMPAEVVRERAAKAELPKDDLAWRLATEMLVSRSTMDRRLDELHLF